MAAITAEDLSASRRTRTNLGQFGVPGQIPLKVWRERGLEPKGFGRTDLSQLDFVCEDCMNLPKPERVAGAAATECGCITNLEGTRFCARHAVQQRVCRRCGKPR
jgi:hypothetical protein